MEKETRRKNPHFITSTISLGSFSIISIALGLVGTIVVTRHFSPIVFGIYSLVLVIESFLRQLSTLGLEMGISRFIAGSDSEEKKENLLSTAAIMRMTAILLMCLLAWISRPYLLKLFGGSSIADFFIYIPLLFVLDNSRTFFGSVLQGCLLFPRIGVIDVSTSFLTLSLQLVMIYVFKSNNIAWLLLIKAFSTFLACVLGFVSIPIKKRLSFHLDDFKKLIKFGFPLQINDILQLIQTRIDSLVVGALLGPANLAYYEVARKIPDQLRSLYEPFRAVYYPFLTKRYELEDRKKASNLLNDSMRFVAFVTLLGTAIAVIFSKDIIRLLFSEKYLSSAPVFVILMINLSIALVSNVMGTTLVAVGDSSKPLIINSFNAIISLVGSILLIPGYQIIGAAVANTAGTTVAYPLNVFFLRRRINFSNAAFLKPVALLSVWSILVILIKPESIYLKTGFLIAFLAGCFLFSIITREDIFLLAQGLGIFNWKLLRRFGIRGVK